jgi:hypothetical protein
MLDTNVIFAAALGITEPWYVESVEFNSESKKLEIHLNFKKAPNFHSLMKMEVLKAIAHMTQ